MSGAILNPISSSVMTRKKVKNPLIGEKAVFHWVQLSGKLIASRKPYWTVIKRGNGLSLKNPLKKP